MALPASGKWYWEMVASTKRWGVLGLVGLALAGDNAWQDSGVMALIQSPKVAAGILWVQP